MKKEEYKKCLDNLVDILNTCEIHCLKGHRYAGYHCMDFILNGIMMEIDFKFYGVIDITYGTKYVDKRSQISYCFLPVDYDYLYSLFLNRILDKADYDYKIPEVMKTDATKRNEKIESVGV